MQIFRSQPVFSWDFTTGPCSHSPRRATPVLCTTMSEPPGCRGQEMGTGHGAKERKARKPPFSWSALHSYKTFATFWL